MLRNRGWETVKVADVVHWGLEIPVIDSKAAKGELVRVFWIETPEVQVAPVGRK